MGVWLRVGARFIAPVYKRKGTEGTFTLLEGTEIYASETSWTDKDVVEGTEYQYRLAYLTVEGKNTEVKSNYGDTTNQGTYYDTSNVITYKKPASTGGDSGGSGSGSGSSSGTGSGTGFKVVSVPSVTSMQVTTSAYHLLTVDVDLTVACGSYEEDGYTSSGYETLVELYRNGKLVGTQTTYGSYCDTMTSPVSYGKKDTFLVKTYMVVHKVKYAGGTKQATAQSAQIYRPTGVKATKISAKQAVVRWD